MERQIVEPIDERELAQFNTLLRDLDVSGRLAWAHDTYGDDLVMVTSFGPSSMVILDSMARIRPDIHVLSIDTDFLFPETYALMDTVRDVYPSIHIERIGPNLTPEQQAQDYGEALWKRDPDLCCFLRKVTPLAEALSGKSAWITGIRRDQSHTRTATPFVQWDQRNELVKICPLADWSEKQVWDYIRKNGLPYNRLHDQNYPSIGCIHCTRPVRPGEDRRAGRWDGMGKTECGLHMDIPRDRKRV